MTCIIEESAERTKNAIIGEKSIEPAWSGSFLNIFKNGSVSEERNLITGE